MVYKPPKAKIRPLDDTDFIWPDMESIIQAQKAVEAPSTAVMQDNGVLYLRERIWIPADAHDLLTRLVIIAHCGSMGHRGHQCIASHIRQLFTISHLDEKLAAFLRSCLLCPHIRGAKIIQRPHGREYVVSNTAQPRTALRLSIMGETWQGSKYVLVLKDDLTHFVRLIACDSPTSQVAVDAIMDWSAMFGVPNVWISDGDSLQEQNHEGASARLKVQHNIVLTYCPWRNGTAERVNRDILAVM
ncbi:hypothetical protein AaE_008116 [Aphanomyces astaci]|uniref:Integrase catalytic domain-containing protein n=1 Tax=Aphanomyces astaci TaxID=112090 RepID=A0A6A5A899_APHAT|nr:hypothetical protein AaE_008116 [Aphanomyces astaci]